jgi:hypothetical protein
MHYCTFYIRSQSACFNMKDEIYHMNFYSFKKQQIKIHQSMSRLKLENPRISKLQ